MLKEGKALSSDQAGCGQLGPRRVAYVVEEFPAVSETFVFNEILEVERRGVAVRIFSLSRPRAAPLHEAARQLMQRTIYLDSLPLLTRIGAWLSALVSGRVRSTLKAARARAPAQAWYARHSLALAGLLRQSEVDHVHAHFATRATALGLPAARIAGATFSLTAHRYDVFDAPIDGLGAMVDAADACVGVSVELIQRLTGQHGADASAIFLIPCGVDIRAFAPNPRGVGAVPSLITVARLSEVKDLHTAVGAAAILKQRGVAFRWQVIGEGPQREGLAALIEREGLRVEFELLGAQDSDFVRAALASANLFVLCSLSEGAPVAIMEAMAMALPVVSTSVGGIPQMVINGETGLLVSPSDARGLADAIEQLLADPARAAFMGSYGRELAESRFSLSHQVDQLMDVWKFAGMRCRGGPRVRSASKSGSDRSRAAGEPA